MAKRNNGQSPDDVEAAIEDILGWLPHYQNKITCPQITSRFDPKTHPGEFHKLYESDPTQMHELALKDAEANAWMRAVAFSRSVSPTHQCDAHQTIHKAGCHLLARTATPRNGKRLG